MSSKGQPVAQVPTNIITGFLGVGKTSAILHILKSKPSDQRWAVLVNEFGEIGVDGSLLDGQGADSEQVFIREVPGGCMCCAAGLPMQIALNQLLAKAKPDRLLIEPTGLGHPKEVLAVLNSEHYQEVLSLQKTITLVDARNLADRRYTEHDTFNQQIAIADRVVGNKQDLYAAGDQERLADYIETHGRAEAEVTFTQFGELSLDLLVGATQYSTKEHVHHHGHSKPVASELPLPDSGVLSARNEGEGFTSMGWRFSPEKTFDRSQLVALLKGLSVERMKGVFITTEGVFGYNMTADGLMEVVLDDCLESRIELIAERLDESFEAQLMDCLEEMP